MVIPHERPFHRSARCDLRAESSLRSWRSAAELAKGAEGRTRGRRGYRALIGRNTCPFRLEYQEREAEGLNRAWGTERERAGTLGVEVTVFGVLLCLPRRLPTRVLADSLNDSRWILDEMR